MSFKDELQSIDGDDLVKTAQASLDKISIDPKEISYIFDSVRSEYPALKDLLNFLMQRYKLQTGDEIQAAALVGAGAVVMTFYEYAEVQEMKEQFPDINE